MCAYVVYEQNQLELNRKPIFWRMNFSLKNGIIKGNSVVKEWRDGYTSDAEHKQTKPAGWIFWQRQVRAFRLIWKCSSLIRKIWTKELCFIMGNCTCNRFNPAKIIMI